MKTKLFLLGLLVVAVSRQPIDADDFAINNNERGASQDRIMNNPTPDLQGLSTVGERYRNELMSASTAAGTKYMSSLQPDGAWGDLNYTRLEFPYAHITRCSIMLRAYNKTDDPHQGSPEMLDAALRSFHKWVQEDTISGNWFYEQITKPQQAAYIMLIGRGQIPAEDWSKGISIINRGWPVPDPTIRHAQNLVYRINQTLIKGIIEDDPTFVHSVIQTLEDEISLSEKAGIKFDWSFHQHGPQLYWGGYGYGFSSDISKIALKVAGTPYALDPEKLDLIASLLLDGQQWAIRGDALDPGVTGRGVSRPYHANAANGLAAACDRLVQLGTSRCAELKNMARNIRGEEGGVPLSGNRHFFTSDFMAHHRPGFYTSFKMASNRVFGTESGNNEGLKNFHLPDGATWLFRRGDEYDHIFPVLDWKRIPGITCEQYKTPSPLCEWGNQSWSNSSWAGGASDGMYGAATFHLNRLNVMARKSGFYFDDGFVLLGAGISCDNGSEKVLTSINQCLLKSDVAVHNGMSVSVFPRGQRTYSDLKWIHHDEVGYVPLSAQAVTVQVAEQSGSYHDINHSYSADIRKSDIFSLFVDHGVKPATGTYACAILPGIDRDALDAWAVCPPVEVLSNTRELQAVVHKGIQVAGAAFMRPGAVTIDKDLTVSVDAPCVVVIRYSRDRFAAAVASPENKALTVHLRVNRKSPEAKCGEAQRASCLTYHLPDGDYAGQSVVKELVLLDPANACRNAR